MSLDYKQVLVSTFEDLEAKSFKISLKVQSCKLSNNKQMIVLTQITNPENFGFIYFIDFTLMSHKDLVYKQKG